MNANPKNYDHIVPLKSVTVKRVKRPLDCLCGSETRKCVANSNHVIVICLFAMRSRKRRDSRLL